MKIFKIITLIILIVGLLFYCFVSTICLQKEYEKSEDLRLKLDKQYSRNEELRLTIDELTGFTDTTLSQAIAWIEESRRSHEKFINNPEWCNEQRGTLEFHRSCIDKYDKVLEVLRYYSQ